MPAGQEGQVVEIFTDGACLGNPGPGGWGAILRSGRHEKELYGGDPVTTNNRMELMAAIQGLESLTRPSADHESAEDVPAGLSIPRWVLGRPAALAIRGGEYADDVARESRVEASLGCEERVDRGGVGGC